MSRFARINSSAAALIAGQILQIAAQIVVTPLYLQAWGPTVFGIWLTVSAAVSYLAYADIGVTAYVMPRLMKSYVERNWSKVDADMHNATAAVCGLIGSCAVLGGVLVVGALALGVDPLRVLLAALLSLQALVLIIQFFVGMPYSVVSLPQRAYANATCYAAVQFVSNLVVLLLSGSPIQLATAQLGVTSIRLVHTWFDTRRVAPRVRPGLSAARWSDVLALLPPSGERALAGFTTLLSQQGTLLAVSGALGPASAAVFSTQRTLVNFARMPQMLIASAVYVEFAELHVKNDHVTGARLLQLSTAVTIAVTFPLLGVLFLYGPEIYELWMHGHLAADMKLFGMLCLEVTLLMPLYMVRTVLLSSNEHRRSVWVEFVAIVAIVAATGLFAGRVGAWIAPASAVVLQAPFFAIVVLRGVRGVLAGAWRPAAFVVLFCKGLVLASVTLALCAGLRYLAIGALARIGLGFAGAAAVGSFGLWLWLISGEDRRALMERAWARFRR